MASLKSSFSDKNIVDFIIKNCPYLYLVISLEIHHEKSLNLVIFSNVGSNFKERFNIILLSNMDI